MPEVTVKGIRLVYEVRGEGPPVLLVCGTLQPAASWWMLNAPAIVDAGNTVITFDNRGVPPSDVPSAPYSVPDMAGDAIGLMEHLGLGPYRVVGASLGGMITQTIALRRPDLVRAAVFIVSGGNLSAYSRLQLRANIDLLALGDLPESFLTRAMLPVMLPPAALLDDAAVESAGAMAAMFGTVPREGMLGQYEADLAWAQQDHLTELEGLAVPALAIANEYDLEFPPAGVKDAVTRMPNGEFAMIPGAPHVALDKVEELNAYLLPFLARYAG